MQTHTLKCSAPAHFWTSSLTWLPALSLREYDSAAENGCSWHRQRTQRLAGLYYGKHVWAPLKGSLWGVTAWQGGARSTQKHAAFRLAVCAHIIRLQRWVKAGPNLLSSLPVCPVFTNVSSSHRSCGDAASSFCVLQMSNEAFAPSVHLNTMMTRVRDLIPMPFCLNFKLLLTNDRSNIPCATYSFLIASSVVFIFSSSSVLQWATLNTAKPTFCFNSGLNKITSLDITNPQVKKTEARIYQDFT